MQAIQFEKERHAKGLTTVETLTLTACIALFIGLWSPTLSRTAEVERESVCIKNLRQLWIAMMAYAHDNNGWSPAAYDGKLPWNSALILSGYLPSQTKGEPSVFVCPDAEPCVWMANWGKCGCDATYGMHAHPTNPTGAPVHFRLGEKTVTSSTDHSWESSKFILLADSIFVSETYPKLHGKQVYILEEGRGGERRIHTRHDDQANVLFGDGHVRACTSADLMEAGWKNIETQLQP